MKYLGLILVVALVAGQVLAQRINENDRRAELIRIFNVQRGYSEGFRNFLEKFKITMREGNETLGVPQLDPYKRDFYATNVSQNFMSGEVQLGDFEVLGLSQYNVRTAEVSVFWRTLTIGLTWPRLHSIGDYKINAALFGGKPVWGQGEYEVAITNLSFDTVVSVGIWSGVYIKSMKTSVSIGGFELTMTGLYNDEDSSAVISQTISDMVPQLVKDYQQEITTAINNKIIAYGNKLLAGKSLSELSALIG